MRTLIFILFSLLVSVFMTVMATTVMITPETVLRVIQK
jgi:hypothetical protein